MLDRILARVLRKLGSLPLHIDQPRPGDWIATTFRDHPFLEEVTFLAGHGDTLADALVELEAKL